MDVRCRELGGAQSVDGSIERASVNIPHNLLSDLGRLILRGQEPQTLQRPVSLVRRVHDPA